MDLYRWFIVGLFLALFGFSFKASSVSAQDCGEITYQVNYDNDLDSIVDYDLYTSVAITQSHEFIFSSVYFVCSITWATSTVDSGSLAVWSWGVGEYANSVSLSVPPYRYSTVGVSAAANQIRFEPDTPIKDLSEIVIYGYQINGPLGGSGGLFDYFPHNLHYLVAPAIISFILALWGAFSGRNQAGHMSAVIVLLIGLSFKNASVPVSFQFLFLFTISFLLMSSVWLSGMLKIFK